MRCLRSLFAVTSLLLFSSSLIGQSPESTPRIRGPVDENSLVVLKGNVPAPARAEFDRGEAPASTQLSHVRLVLARSAEQQAALDKYDAELQDKSSPNYHKWLTPEQFGKLYGPADSDIAVVAAWLQSHGMQVDPLEPGRTNISFSGSVAQIEEMLHVSIHSFEIHEEQFFSNTTNPSIPAALAPVISGVARLNTLQPKPHHVMGPMGLFDKESGRTKALPSATSRAPRADLTSGSGTSSTLYLVPGDAATIYDTPNTVLNANFSSGNSYTGTGVTIGVGGDATIQASTVLSYRQRFISSTDNNPPTISYCGAYTSSGTPACSGSGTGIGTADQDEAYLDVELAGGLAPGAAIHYYASSDLYGAIEAAINQNTVDIFSLSFGACELDMTTADNQILNGWWQQAATQGIAVTVSTGDNGSAACDNNNTETTATGGLKVSGFASTPYNIAVGGTDFGPLLTSFGTYVNPSTSNSATTLYRTAKSYIPEWTWNDSTSVNTTISQNVPYVDPNSGKGNIVAASGGKSTCSVNTTTYNQQGEVKGTCTSGYPKPAWQRGTGVPNDNARDLPDISLMAGAGGDAAAWLVCTDDTTTYQGTTYTLNCTTQNNQIPFTAFGGTSTATPAFAGILALVQQKTGGRLGQAAKELYDLYNGANASAVFHDVTTGNISVPCASTPSVSPDCAKNAAGNYSLTGYDTSKGYDLASGMGSVDVNNLIKYWGTATGDATATVTVSPSVSTLPITQSLTVDVTVAGSGGLGTPTGTVTISGGGYTSSAQALSNGSTSFTIAAGSLAVGTDTLTAIYNGDATNMTYGIAQGTATVTVTAPTFSLSATNVTVTAGTPGTSTVTVTPGNGYTGTVTLTAQVQSGPSGAIDTPTFTGSQVAITDASAKQGTITVSTTQAAAVRVGSIRRSAWFEAAGGTALAALLLFCVPFGSRKARRILGVFLVIVAASFTAVGCGGGGGGGGGGKTTPTVTVSTTKSTFTTAETIPVSITVSGGATGSVTLSSGSYSSGSTNLSNGSASITVPAKTFSAGSITLTAAYSGDTNFNSATGTEAITIVKSGTTAGTYTIQVTGTGSDAAKTTASTTFTLTVN